MYYIEKVRSDDNKSFTSAKKWITIESILDNTFEIGTDTEQILYGTTSK